MEPVKVEKKVLETDVENAVCRYARARGLMALKFTSPNRRSVPDRIFLAPGAAVFFIEFKRPGVTEATGAQLREHARLRRLGRSEEHTRRLSFTVHLVNSADAGKAIIDHWAKGTGCFL